MTGDFTLDWAVLAVSLFNTILLLWLGLTVFLNAESRVWGIWLATAGLLLGAIFFISHSAILGHGVSTITPGLNFWWQIGWIPVAALPLVWYLVMLWYCGFWERHEETNLSRNKLYQRHKIWFSLTLLTGIFLLAYLLLSNPLPSFSQLAANNLGSPPSIIGIPLLVLGYPIYTLLCTGLSIDVLRHPEPSTRLMGDLARIHASRWLISATLMLLIVGLLVGWVMGWIVGNVEQGLLSLGTLEIIGKFDFVIETLIAVSVLSLGQAVVTYEVFTGKTLPRRGLSQYWRRAVILAAGYSLLLALGLTLQLHPIYSILLSMLLIVVFYALLGWRAFAERERIIQNLRPFVTYRGIYDGILDSEKNRFSQGIEDINEPFRALCEDILEARQACLVPLGALASLTGKPLVYPNGNDFPLPDLSEVIPRLGSPVDVGIPLTSEMAGEMVFAVSLWSERGLIGVLLLGEKGSGNLYTQEEIEIARSVGEHLIDIHASMEMARRLVNLQRQRLVQSQVVDQQTRRVLHDEILPLVHTSLLNLAGSDYETGGTVPDAISQLEEIHRRLSDLLSRLPATTAVEVRRLGFTGALRKLIDVEIGGAFDEIAWTLQPEIADQFDKIPTLVAEVVFFAAREVLRNAARHGRQESSGTPFCLAIDLKYQNGLVIKIEDNGAGFAFDQPSLFSEGGSPQLGQEDASTGAGEDSSKRWTSTGGYGGHGLALHSTMMAVIGGSMTVESAPGQHTRITLEVPELAWQS
jgi:signal transduction histidine kinase